MSMAVGHLWNKREFVAENALDVQREFDMPMTDPSECAIITDVAVCGDGAFASKNAPIPLDVFFDQFGVSKQSSGTKRKHAGTEHLMRLTPFEKFPWLKTHVTEKAGMGDASCCKKQVLRAQEPMKLDEDILREVDEAREDIR